jgi:hypothetical protein
VGPAVVAAQPDNTSEWEQSANRVVRSTLFGKQKQEQEREQEQGRWRP